MSKREFIENGVLELGNLVSCGHPHRGVEAHAACRLARCDGAPSRLGRPAAVGAQPLEVEGDGALYPPQRRVDRLPRRHAARKVGNGCPTVTARVLVDTDQILEFSHEGPRRRPAWRSTDASVPFGISSPG